MVKHESGIGAGGVGVGTTLASAGLKKDLGRRGEEPRRATS